MKAEMSLGRFLGALVVLVALALWSTIAQAAPPAICALTDDALAALATRYDERPFWVGIMSDGQSVMTLTASPDGATWTALISATNGQSCMAAVGRSSSTPGPPAPDEEG